MSWIAAVGAVSVASGVLVLVAALRPAGSASRPPRMPPLLHRLRANNTGVSAPRGRRVGVIVGAVLGLLVWLVTGWMVAAVILPAAAAVVPALLQVPDTKGTIKRLEAMEEWTRNLAGVLTVGVGLDQAIIASLRSTPEQILPEVSTLVARLRVRWRTEDALRAFAEDLNDPTGDRIATSLIVGSRSRGHGLALVLERLAETVSDEVRMRRRIETDRAKPRATARYVTIIVILTTVALALTGDYVAPYGESAGQIMLVLWLGAYLGCLLWMRQITSTKGIPRFLGVNAREHRGR
jgi:Flp pilus assembly protein TadB